MTMEVETLVAISLMMAVFSAVAAVGTSIVLGAGFERLRAGFDVISKQTGFFSDAIRKLEGKVEQVDEQTQNFSKSIQSLDAKVANVGDQANVFSDTMSQMGEKIERVDKQTGFFSDAIHKLEERVEKVNEHEAIVSSKIEKAADTDVISAGKADALVSHAEDLLVQVSTLAAKIDATKNQEELASQSQTLGLHLPQNISQFSYKSPDEGGQEIRIH